MLFLNDIGVKGPRTTYNSKEVLLGVHRFVIEYIQVLDKTLEQLERVGYIIGPKLQFCINRIVIVGFVYRVEGRSLETTKVIKILK